MFNGIWAVVAVFAAVFVKTIGDVEETIVFVVLFEVVVTVVGLAPSMQST